MDFENFPIMLHMLAVSMMKIQLARVKTFGCGGKTTMHFIAVSSGLSQNRTSVCSTLGNLFQKKKTIYNIHVEVDSF